MVEVDPMGVSAVEKLLPGFAGRESNPACVTDGQSIASSRRGWIGSFALGVALLTLAPDASRSGVLSESDFKKVEAIKPLFQNLMGDLVQTSKLSVITRGGSDCVMSPIRELLQIYDELSS